MCIYYLFFLCPKAYKKSCWKWGCTKPWWGYSETQWYINQVMPMDHRYLSGGFCVNQLAGQFSTLSFAVNGGTFTNQGKTHGTFEWACFERGCLCCVLSWHSQASETIPNTKQGLPFVADWEACGHLFGWQQLVEGDTASDVFTPLVRTKQSREADSERKKRAPLQMTVANGGWLFGFVRCVIFFNLPSSLAIDEPESVQFSGCLVDRFLGQMRFQSSLGMIFESGQLAWQASGGSR